MLSWFNCLTHRYKRKLLLKTVRQFEDYCFEKKCWKVDIDVARFLSQLLLINKELLSDKAIINSLSEVRIKTSFDNLKTVENFVNDFINQTDGFVLNEYSGRPRVTNSAYNAIGVNNVSIAGFLEVRDYEDMANALNRIVLICDRLQLHIERASLPRQALLKDMLVSMFTPIVVSLQQTYEVLNEYR